LLSNQPVTQVATSPVTVATPVPEQETLALQLVVVVDDGVVFLVILACDEL
jgi:hypothetical protein